MVLMDNLYFLYLPKSFNKKEIHIFCSKTFIFFVYLP